MSEIGPFRLLQKIEEDVLGEVHCAAWTGDDGREETALLRLFDPRGVDPDGFERRIRGHLATSLRLGVAGGRAYDLFPYVSGQSLAALIRRARRRRKPLPLPVALFVAGRLAAALADAYRQQVDGEPAVHGFVVPCLARISEEGRIQLCGLEAAPALRAFRGTAADFCRLLPYLSPESAADGDLHPSDDVYSLGALVYELLTFKRLASASDLRDDSDDIPCELRYLLARSVAPRFLRVQSAVDWLRELKALVVQEGWGATAEDLSSFVAGVDERLHPPRHDSAEISAEDRELLAEAIRRARAAAVDEEAADAAPGPAAEEAGATDGEAEEEKPGGYDTSVIPKDVVEPVADRGRLLKTSHVKRAAQSLPLPPAGT